MPEHQELMGGKLHIYRRENSSKWQCSTFLNNKNWRVSTKEDSLALAKEFAEDWYPELRGKSRAGQLKVGKSFKEAAAKFEGEFEIITQRERSPIYVNGHKQRLKNHLVPFFGDYVVTEITPGLMQDYRIHRMKNGRRGKPPARSTLHQEIVCLRQVLQTANRHGWLPYLPNISPPYKTSGKITHRAWFSPTRVQDLVRGDARTREEPEEGTLADRMRKPARLRAVHGQHRAAARRSAPPRISRRRHRHR